VIDFEFTPEQYALRDAARELFEKECSPSRLRAVWDADGVRDDGAWRALASVGITGLTIPESYGGQGGDALDLVLVLEEAGRAALPEPIVEAVAVGAPLLHDAGSDEQRARWLPRFAAGKAVPAVRLDGSFYAPDADRAGVLLFEHHGDLQLVERFTAAHHPTVDRARRLFTVGAGDGEPLEPGHTKRARDRGAAATAAFLNGVSMRLLEMTIEHAKGRQQFGRAIGSFQAVKHMLADWHVALEAARPAAWYAAYALARGLPDASRAASVAKIAASDAHVICNREALQVHGGIGFTWEHDLHLWLKRGLALVPAFGTAAQHRLHVADALFEEED
jgi:alkylation response protein AidB-like acyl-CoA dehydrogenase